VNQRLPAASECGYCPAVDTESRPRSSGSRTAGYLVAGALATVPALFVLCGSLGVYGGVGGVFLWTTGIVWLLKKRQEDPTWDKRPATGRR
jgi:hypothetical protein